MVETKLSRASIVDTAITVADTEGLDGLSMRRIAERLGVGAMSLYRHVASKDELLAAMTDEVSRRNPYPAPPAGARWSWRERVHIAADVDRALYQRHPWVLLAFAMPRYSFGPYSLRCLAWLVEGFGELGVDTAEATRMAFAVWNYISGCTLPLVSEVLVRRTEERDGAGNPLRALLTGQSVAEMPEALGGLAGRGLDALDNDLVLRSGLDALCDGFAALHARA
ncbi:TetR family transcriptional regulator [Nocardia sp. NPDC050697]|uniref:TetR/AcrR family transcriptional regulator n=1 Tax=Nocardia sp. NPDC050697 TaxID=3155158 RepID=UPI0033E92488